MSVAIAAAQITGFTVWALIAWALANRAVTILTRLEDERRRRRNARRHFARKWPPPSPPRHRQDPDHQVTRVLPGIQRPNSP